ncbi:MAG: ATP synthase F1 subunit delta [Bacteroidales bacterium]|nr:ATP synthase F1 subunit delta [Bacteroidales bacterium]
MNSGLIARRYANVLFEFAQEHQATEVVYSDASNVYEALVGSQEATAFLTSPLRKPSEKKALVDKVFANVVSKETRQFMDFVVDKGRADMLAEILRVYGVVFKEHNGIKTAIVTTAVPLEAQKQESVTAILKQKLAAPVEATYKVDESLIGGVVFEVDGSLMDCSVKRQLQDIERSLTI